MVDRNRAELVMRESGAYDAEDIAAKTDEQIAEWVLWQACCDFHEWQLCVARGQKPGDTNSGTDYYYLGA